MIEIVETIEGMNGIAEEWRAVASRFPTPLLQYEWFEAAARAFCPPQKLQLLVLKRDGKVAAIAPLAILKAQTEGRLEILGTETLCEPSGFLYETRDDLNALIDHIIEMRMPSNLRRLAVDSREVEILDEKHKGLGFKLEHSTGSPWLPVTLPWTEYENTISSKDRYTFRRARTRADEFGKVEFVSVSPRPGEVGGCFDELVRIESLSWKEKEQTSLGAHPFLNPFFRRYMASSAAQGTLRVNFLKIDGIAVAFVMAVEFANRTWVLKISFDEAFAHCSPGILLMHEAIRLTFAWGQEAIEFLGTDEPWLHDWTNDVHHYVGIHLYPLSLRGLFALGSDGASYLLNRLPSLKSRADKE